MSNMVLGEALPNQPKPALFVIFCEFEPESYRRRGERRGDCSLKLLLLSSSVLSSDCSSSQTFKIIENRLGSASPKTNGFKQGSRIFSKAKLCALLNSAPPRLNQWC